MRSLPHSAAIITVLVGAAVLATGRVAAASDADPQPGFGVTIAIIAILIAMGIARRKQKDLR